MSPRDALMPAENHVLAMSAKRVLGISLIALGAFAMLTGSLVAASGATIAVATGMGTEATGVGGWSAGWFSAVFGLVAFLAGSLTHVRAQGFM